MGEKDKLFWESRLTRQNFLESGLKTFSKRSRSNLTGVKASPLLTLHLTGKGGGGGGTTGTTKNKVKLDLNLGKPDLQYLPSTIQFPLKKTAPCLIVNRHLKPSGVQVYMYDEVGSVRMVFRRK